MYAANTLSILRVGSSNIITDMFTQILFKEPLSLNIDDEKFGNGGVIGVN